MDVAFPACFQTEDSRGGNVDVGGALNGKIRGDKDEKDWAVSFKRCNHRMSLVSKSASCDSRP